jgi:NTP pyrophosphatase (non-canonical NTP hydrolase)
MSDITWRDLAEQFERRVQFLEGELKRVNQVGFGRYQSDAARTMSSHGLTKESLAIAGLGLTGEAGEVADLVKKHVGHGHELNRERLLEEAGDVLWYLAMLCTLLEADLGTVAAANIEKLKKRYPSGFDVERSKAHGR